jgi:uncharacterized protein YjiS (DUF1127 family)
MSTADFQTLMSRSGGMAPYYGRSWFALWRDEDVTGDCDVVLTNNAWENRMSSIKNPDIKAEIDRARTLASIESRRSHIGNVPPFRVEPRAASSSIMSHLIDSFALGAASIYAAPWHIFEGQTAQSTPSKSKFDGTPPFEPWSYVDTEPFAEFRGGLNERRWDGIAARTSSDEGVFARPAKLGWARRVKSTITKFFDYLAYRREISRASASLSQLDDRMLRDIGLDRGHVEHAVRHGRGFD